MKIWMRAAIIALLVFAWPVAAWAQTSELAMPGDALSPAEVVALDRELDGSVVMVEGEAVGDILRAPGGGRWVNILGEEVGLGIWMADELAEEIEHLGEYHHDGDVVRVVGTVTVACQEHSGEFDVHAQSLEIVSVGEPRAEEVRYERGIIGLLGIGVGLVLWLRYRALRG